MNPLTRLTISSIYIGLFSTSLPAHAGLGEDTANAMTNYYNDTSPYCGKISSPAFMCSGILLRATVPSPSYHSWNPSPKSDLSGGVSFSYLRVDATFSKLAYGYNNGFTLFPYNYAPKNTIEPEVLCSFPVDAGTDARDNKGCGDHSNTSEIEKSCEELDIKTAEAWRNNYVANGRNNAKECGFDVRDNRNADGARSFYETIRAMSLFQTLPAATQNELRLATWKKDSPLPVQSFFYIDDGLSDAQADQADWFKTTGKFLPIIGITLPKNATSTTIFTYKEADQSICETYIESGSWIKRMDPGVNREVWTLEVTPTACGRQIKEDQTNAAYAELLNKFGNAPEWLSENGGGMRRQLVCHLVIARDKPTWNLEPFRPDVSHQKSVAADCNAIAP